MLGSASGAEMTHFSFNPKDARDSQNCHTWVLRHFQTNMLLHKISVQLTENTLTRQDYKANRKSVAPAFPKPPMMPRFVQAIMAI